MNHRPLDLDAKTTCIVRPPGWVEDLPDLVAGSTCDPWHRERAALARQREEEAKKAARREKIGRYISKVFSVGTAASAASGMR